MQTLAGRTCVFAGATGNIGRGAVRALAESGMNIVMVTHNPAAAEEICNAFGNCAGRVVAISNKNGDAAALSQSEQMFGSVDVVINSTGGLHKVETPEQITAQILNERLSHQVTEPFLMMQAAIPYLEKSKHARMILVTSTGALDGFPGENMADSIARGGIITMTYCLARELASKKITVNCVTRGGMVNDHEPCDEDDYDVTSIAKEIPIGHIGTADEFGALLAYIASEEAAFVTGHVFNLSGGIHIG